MFLCSLCDFLCALCLKSLGTHLAMIKIELTWNNESKRFACFACIL